MAEKTPAEIGSLLQSEHYERLNGLVKTLTALSFATTSGLIGVSLTVGPLPIVLQLAALVSLIALVAGIVCMYGTVRNPLLLYRRMMEARKKGLTLVPGMEPITLARPLSTIEKGALASQSVCLLITLGLIAWHLLR